MAVSMICSTLVGPRATSVTRYCLVLACGVHPAQWCVGFPGDAKVQTTAASLVAVLTSCCLQG